MIEIFKHANYNFLGKKWVFIGLSWVLILAGAVSVCYRAFDGKDYTHPFNMGVDFSGGSMATIKFKTQPNLEELRQSLEKQGIEGNKISLQPVGELGKSSGSEVIVRLPDLVSLEREKGHKVDTDIGKNKLKAALSTFNDASTKGKFDINAADKSSLTSKLIETTGLTADRAEEIANRVVDYREKSRGGLIGSIGEIKNLGGIDPQLGDALQKNFFAGAASVKSFDAVSPQVGSDLRNSAILVTLVSCIGMLIFVAFRFKSWGFGIGSIIAVVHDVLVTLGIFSIMQWEINLTVIAALLTLVGYSMNDTIVIFDRIREMLRTKRREGLEKLSNDAINQTLSRTIIASGLTFLTVCAMLVFGGEVLRSFSWALFIGIIIGTYSSIYIASPFMLMWEDWRTKTIAAKVSGINSSNVGTNSTTAESKSTQSEKVGESGVTRDMLAAAGISIAPRKPRKK